MAESKENIPEKSDGADKNARLDQMESRISNLEESINRAVGTMMPKVDALLSQRNDGEISTSTLPAASTAASPPASLLGLAGRGDHEALLRLVADMETNIQINSQRTKFGDTALHVAASKGHVKAVVVLMGMGAKVNASGHRLRTPLHSATSHGHLAVAQRLLVAGAQVDEKDADGATPLGLAAGQGHGDLVILLLRKGAKVNEKAVANAAENGHWNLVELFLQSDQAFVNGCNKEGDPLIVLAAKGNRWEMVEQLLQKGAAATKCKTSEKSALVYASKAGQADVVRGLLKLGAASNTEQVGHALNHAKSAAVVWTFVDVVPDKIRGRAAEIGLMNAGISGRLEPLEAFLDAAVNIDAKDDKGCTTLYFSAFNGRLDCLSELLKRAPDINKKNNEGNTPLHATSLNGHVQCVRALIHAGASTTETNNEGNTPLEVATSDEVRQPFNEKGSNAESV